MLGDGRWLLAQVSTRTVSDQYFISCHRRSDQDVPFPALRHCGLRFGGCRRGPGCRQGTVRFCWDMPSMFLLSWSASKHAYPKRITYTIARVAANRAAILITLPVVGDVGADLIVKLGAITIIVGTMSVRSTPWGSTVLCPSPPPPPLGVKRLIRSTPTKCLKIPSQRRIPRLRVDDPYCSNCFSVPQNRTGGVYRVGRYMQCD